SLSETNATLTDSGTLTVSDVDTTDLVTASVDTVAVTGTGSTSLSNAALKAMLSVAPTAILDGTETSDTLTWSFDSGTEAFNELATGETLILTYTVKAIDDAGTPLSDTETVTITITGSNDDPTAANNTVTTNEDATYTFAASDFNFADIDDDTLGSVEITSLESAGDLKLNNVDVTLNQVITKADIDANKLKFIPVANANGNAYDSFGFSVNDGTADSTASYTMAVNVTAVNDAPVLNTAASPTLTSITEDAVNPTGDTIAALVVDGSITDADGSAVEAIAITSTGNGYGSWEYSVNGGANWTAVGTVSPSSALLLAATDMLRYIPDGQHGETQQISYRAWDQSGVTAGLHGTKVSTVSNGGITPFSSALETAYITVTTVNDTPAAVNDAYSVDEDGTLNSSAAWFDDDWAYRRTLSFDNLDQTEDLANFPVLVKLDATRIDYTKTSDAGEDLRFVDADGNLLAHQVEQWDESGTSYVWVKVAQVDGASGSDFIHMYYGNVAAVSAEGQVWSENYQAVYHLNEAAGVIADSTANSFDGSNNDSVDGSGFVGNGQVFNGSNQWIDLGSQAFLNNTPAATLSAWIKTDTLSGSGDIVSVSVDTSGGASPQASRAAINQVGDEVQVVLRANDANSGDVRVITTTTSPLAVGEWHYVSAVIDYANDSLVIYVDGVEQTLSGAVSFTNTATPNTDSSYGAIGSNEAGANSFFDGSVDEVRIANTARSADWMAAQYASMSDHFVTISPQQEAAGVLDNDIDPDGDSLTVNTTPISDVTNGTLLLNADGSFSYTPDAGFNGSDSFTYQVSDGNGGVNTATVTITVNAVNNAPVLTGDLAATVAEAGSYTLTATDLGYTDPDDVDAGVTFSASSFSNGKLQVSGVDASSFTGTQLTAGVVTFVHDGSETTSAAFDINVDDGDEDSSTPTDSTFNFTVTPVNDAPAGADKTVTTNEDTDYTFASVDFGYSDSNDSPANDLLNVIITAAPANGTLYVDSNNDGLVSGGEALADAAVVSITDINAGRLKFKPASDANGTAYDSFTFQVQDDGGVANSGVDTDQSANTITINVTAQADAASITVTAADTAVTEDEAGNNTANGTVTVSDVDTGEGSLTSSIATYGTVTVDGSGNWSYALDNSNATVQALAAGDTLADSITFTSDDGTTQTQSITITGANDAPTLGNGTLTSVAEDTANPAGETVSDIFTGQFADIDTGSSFGGIAVTGNSANAITQGSWQYSTNAGSDWFAIGTVADDATALALSDSTLIRFMPVADYHGTPTAMEVRGLDDSYTGGFSATAGSETRVVVDTTSNGDVTAIAADPANLSTAITAVADTSSVTDATTDEDTQSTTGLVITPNGADGAEVTHFKVTGIANGTLYKNDGITQINDDDFITVAEGAAGLKFTPATDFNGDGSFTAQASTSNVDAGLGGSTAEATITVNPVNDAPVVDLDSDNSSGAGSANYTTIFTEDGGPVALADVLDASLSDPDLENLVSLTVTIANPLDGANEWLAADTTGTVITASYDSGTGVLSLTGADSVANYQQVLRSLTYDNSSEDPDITARVITVVANDGTEDSNTVTWNPPAPQGLVGYWNFDEGMGEQAFDLSGNGNHATLTNTTLAADWVEGNTGQALNFTGTEDYVEVPYSDELKLDGDFTITLWNKPDSVDTRTRVIAQYGNTQWGTNGDGWMINQYGDDLYWYYQSSGPTSGAANVFAVGEWAHIAISRSGDTFTLYVDGVQKDQDTRNTTTNPFTPLGNHSLYFGSGAASQNHDGALDDVRIYDKALTAGEIDAVYQDRGATTVVNMVAVNDAPLVTSSVGTTAYSEQAAATIIDSGITLVDADGFNGADPSDQYTAVIRVTANYETADILSFTNTSNIQGVLTGDLLTLSVITGQTATLAEFETALRSVTFYNNSDNPGEMDRTITFSFDDGVDSSNLSTKTIQVTALNDDPTNAGLLQSASVVTEDISSTINLSAINLSDADAGAGVLTMTLTTNTGGNLTAAAGTGITIGGNGSGTLTLEGTQTDLNAYLDVVGNVTYLHAIANTSGFAADTIQVDITDNGNTGSGGGGTITLGTFNIDITAVNDAPIAVNDRPGLNFDGVDDFIQIADAPSLVMLDTLTLEAWINLDASAAPEHMILNKEGEYEIAVLNGTIQWAITNTDPGWTWHDTGYIVPTHAWTHIALTYDNGIVKTYANGTLEDTYNGSGDIGDVYLEMDELRIGGRSNNPDGKYFDGQIADVRIWNTVRTDVQINANQNVTLAGSETGLVGYWLLNDGSSTTAIDSSLEGNDGLLGGGVATQAPTWSDFSVDEDGTLTVTAPGVLSNDFDADGDTLMVNTTPIANVSNGVLTLSSDGSFVYTPNADFNGVDSFTYEISDGEGGTDTADVTITVNPVNDAPNLTAGATLDYSEGDAATIIDSTITLADVDDTMLESATIQITGNLQPGKDILTRPAAGGIPGMSWIPSTGTLTLTGTATVAQYQAVLRSVTFENTSDTPSELTRTITWTVNDGNVDSAPQTSTVTVNSVNDAPAGADNTVTTNEDTDYTFSSIDFGFSDSNDSPGDDLLNVIITTAPNNGTLYVDSDNDGLVGVGESLADGATVSATNISAGQLKFKPASDANGTAYDSFTFQVQDDGGVANGGVNTDQSANTITINVTAQADAASISVTAADTAVTEDDAGNNTARGTVTITDVDTGEGTLTSSTATYGTVTVDGSGNWSYTLDNSNATVQAQAAGATLADSITFTSDDGTTQTQSIIITGANDTATISLTAADTAVTEDDAGNNTASGTVTITDLDSGEGSLTSRTASYGTVTVDGSGNWTYTLDNSNTTVQALAAGDTLTDSITFSSDDGTTQTQSITITGANNAAVIGGDTSAAVNEDGTLTDTGALTISDTDDGEAVFTPQTSATSTSGYGSVDLDATGNWTYTLSNANAKVQALSEGEILTDSFTATTADGSTQVVNVTITGKDDAAVIGGDTTATVSEDGTLSDTGALTIGDPDDGEAVFVAQTTAASSSGYGSVDLNDAGNWTYSLNNAHATVQALSEGEILTDSFTATSADGSTQVISVTITGKDDAAVIGGDTTAAVSEDGTLTGTGALTISDTDDGEALFTPQNSAASTSGYGSVDLNAAGNWTYTLNNANPTVQALSEDETLTDSFVATSADGSTQVISVSITGKDDAAVISGDSSFKGNEGDTVVGDLNATDIEGLTDSTYFSVTSEAAKGTAVIDAESGAWSFTPAKSNWFGNDSFEVTVTDDEGGTTSQTVSIMLANVQDEVLTTIVPVSPTPEAVTPAPKP
ncbi:DUF2341 domain-containing protein, partial [Porticoccus sp.]